MFALVGSSLSRPFGTAWLVFAIPTKTPCSRSYTTCMYAESGLSGGNWSHHLTLTSTCGRSGYRLYFILFFVSFPPYTLLFCHTWKLFCHHARLIARFRCVSYGGRTLKRTSKGMCTERKRDPVPVFISLTPLKTIPFAVVPSRCRDDDCCLMVYCCLCRVTTPAAYPPPYTNHRIQSTIKETFNR